MREHWNERVLLGALGVKEVDKLDELLDEAAEQLAAPARRRVQSREQRNAEVSAFIDAVGGM